MNLNMGDKVATAVRGEGSFLRWHGASFLAVAFPKHGTKMVHVDDVLKEEEDMAVGIKKVLSMRVCSRLRCLETPGFVVSGAYWGLDHEDVPMCSKHEVEAVAYYKLWEQPGSVKTRDGDDVALSVFGDEKSRVEVELRAETVDAQDLLAQARVFVVAGQEDLEFIGEVLQEAKGKLKNLEEREQTITKPMNAALKATRDLFAPAKKFLKDVEVELKLRIGEFRLREEQLNQALLQAASEAHAAEQPEAVAEALASVTHVANLPGITTYLKWTWVVGDEALVQREFLSVDPVKVNAWLKTQPKEATPEAAGLVFTQAVQVNSSSK